MQCEKRDRGDFRRARSQPLESEIRETSSGAKISSEMMRFSGFGVFDIQPSTKTDTVTARHHCSDREKEYIPIFRSLSQMYNVRGFSVLGREMDSCFHNPLSKSGRPKAIFVRLRSPSKIDQNLAAGSKFARAGSNIGG
jgi:hypothetical protein